ncbi:MAG: hypothetical protein AAFO29_24190, partial [Actinomycetota bacterium]
MATTSGKHLPVPPPSHRTPPSHRGPRIEPDNREFRAPEASTGPRRSSTALLDRPTAPIPITSGSPRPRLDPGPGSFDLPPALDTPEAMRSPRRSRRLDQAAIAVTVGALAVGLAIVLPNDDA